MELLNNIPVDLEPSKVLKRMHIREENQYIEQIVRELVDTARPLANPKAVYKVSYVENRNYDSVEIDGVQFNSLLLRVNLDKITRVFPYIATSGGELENITIPGRDFMRLYCLDVIKEIALRSATGYLEKHLKKTYALGQLSRMNPGSLPSWPIAQQKELFSLFGNVEELVGVRLTESCLMIPIKSASGIFFPTDVRFESCALCPRAVCSERKAPYNPSLARKYQDGTG